MIQKYFSVLNNSYPDNTRAFFGENYPPNYYHLCTKNIQLLVSLSQKYCTTQNGFEITKYRTKIKICHYKY